MPGTPELRIKNNLVQILDELKTKRVELPPELLSFEEQLQQLEEWINYAGEYGIAYESIVVLLEDQALQITGSAAVRLLETSLLLGYKTDREKDKPYDLRKAAKP
jgi:hypothetical protein